MISITYNEYLGKGLELVIFYNRVLTPYGEAVMAYTGEYLCALEFIDEVEEDEGIILERLHAIWKEFKFLRSEDIAFRQEEKVLLRGTDFQIKVWRALLELPMGKCVSYSELAAAAGCGKGVRAVASAVAANRVGYFVPCHQVIRKNGDLGEYRWGREKKRMMLQY